MRRTRGWKPAAQVAILAAAALTVIAGFGGAAQTATAAAPTLTVTMTAQPSANVPVPLSTTSQPTYVRYSITVSNPSSNVWQDVTLTDPAPSASLGGAVIVFVANCPNGPSGQVSLASLTCSFGTLDAGAAPTPVIVVLRTPTTGSQLVNAVQLSADEGGTDATKSNGNAARTDTFLASVTNPLTASTLTSATSWAPPGQTLNLTTDPNLSPNNPQVTAGAFPSVAGLPDGYLVSLSESAVGTADTCGGARPTSPAISDVNVAADPSNFILNGFTFVFTITVKSGTYQNSDQVVVCHRTSSGFFVVPRTGFGTDPVGDSISNVQFLNANRTVLQVTATGPSNGGWGTW
jgi:Domain of unknown function DUF11